VFVVALDEARTMDWSFMKSLLLAVEVLSPSSTRADRFTKRRLYQEVGVPVYWVVDADEHFVEVWTPDTKFPHFEREELTWHPAGAQEPLRISLPELFKPL
jgi:Uma2 family endonuclease